jgi:SAM-dependent MidA family methyltransferase
MSDPGTADLSADVDFSFLKQTIRERSGKLYANATTRLLNQKKKKILLLTDQLRNQASYKHLVYMLG